MSFGGTQTCRPHLSWMLFVHSRGRGGGRADHWLHQALGQDLEQFPLALRQLPTEAGVQPAGFSGLAKGTAIASSHS